MSSCVVVKEEVTSEVEEEDEEETKRKRIKERRTLYKRERYERIKRICAGEDVPGVGEEERKKIIEMEERRKQKDRQNKRKVRGILREPKRELGEGEDSEGAGEEEEEKIKQWKAKRALNQRKRMERIRRICAGEDVPGITEEQRRIIIEKEEKRKEKNRMYSRKIKREKRDEIRAQRIELYKRRMKEETAEEREARLAKKRFQRLVRSVQRTKTEEEKERERRVRFFWKQAKMATMTEEEWKEEKRKRNEYIKEWKKNFSEEKRKEYLEKLKGSVKRSLQKLKERDPEGYRKRMNEYQRRRLQRLSEKVGVKINECVKYYQKKRYEGMSEEEKRRRLNQMKMYQQKRNLRRKLEGTMDEEEIERRVDELDKRLRVELGIGPPRPKGWLRNKGRDCGAVHSDASCSGDIITGTVEKQEVGQWSGHSFINLNAMTCYADSQAEQLEQAEGSFCDFDEGASMPSPPEATQLNSLSHHSSPQQLEAVTHSIAPQQTPMPMSSPPEATQWNNPSPYSRQQHLEPEAPSIVPEIVELTFSCEYCECSPFLTENDLKSHLQKNHLKICWKCPSCKDVMISSKHLSEHFKAVHKKPSKSSTVDAQTPEKLKAREPTVDVPSFPHNVCQEKSNSKKSMPSFNRKAEYLCLICPFKSVNSSKIITVFKDRKLLHSHVRNKHRKYYWPCEHCHLLKYSKQSLIVHLMLCTKKSET